MLTTMGMLESTVNADYLSFIEEKELQSLVEYNPEFPDELKHHQEVKKFLYHAFCTILRI